jgi:hypothetical protein
LVKIASQFLKTFTFANRCIYSVSPFVIPLAYAAVSAAQGVRQPSASLRTGAFFIPIPGPLPAPSAAKSAFIP